jgi:hypothetical protein
MRVMAPDIFDRWTRAAGLVAVAALVWAVVAPDGVFWNAVLAAGLVGAAVATAVLVRSRSVRGLARARGAALARAREES